MVAGEVNRVAHDIYGAMAKDGRPQEWCLEKACYSPQFPSGINSPAVPVRALINDFNESIVPSVLQDGLRRRQVSQAQ
jgi:hypothetical protein